MSVCFYMDVHVPRPITRGLRVRGVEVITAQEDGAGRLSDPELLDRAGERGAVVFTRDTDFLAETADRQRRGQEFATVVFAAQMGPAIGRCIDDLEVFARTALLHELRSHVFYLPL